MKKSAFLNINSQEIYYELYSQEREEAKYLIFLHEGLGSVAQWKYLPQKIYELTGFNVVVYDRSGYGNSSPVAEDYPLDYLRYEAQSILPQLLQQLNISKCHLWGHSDGGTIALLFAAYHPLKTLSVITEAAHVIIEEISRKGISDIRKLYKSKLQNSLQRYHGQQAGWVFYHWADTWLDADFYNWNMKEELQQIQCPVLAIQGENDEYGSPEQLEIIKELSPAEIHLIPNCGHAPHFQKTAEVLVLVMNFLTVCKDDITQGPLSPVKH